MKQLMLTSKQYNRNKEIKRILDELSLFENKSFENYKPNFHGDYQESDKIKSYCRRIIKKEDPKLEKRLYYALYKSKRGKIENIKTHTNKKLDLFEKEKSI